MNIERNKWYTLPLDVSDLRDEMVKVQFKDGKQWFYKIEDARLLSDIEAVMFIDNSVYVPPHRRKITVEDQAHLAKVLMHYENLYTDEKGDDHAFFNGTSFRYYNGITGELGFLWRRKEWYLQEDAIYDWRLFVSPKNPVWCFVSDKSYEHASDKYIQELVCSYISGTESTYVAVNDGFCDNWRFAIPIDESLRLQE